MTVRVLVDGTPLLGARTGIGRYTAALVRALSSTVDYRVFGLTATGWRDLRRVAPPATTVRGVPVPAGALRRLWSFVDFPPLEFFAGTADVVHGTNFALPPSPRTPGVLTVHDVAYLNDPTAAPGDLAGLVRRGARRAAVVCTPTHAVATAACERLRLPESKIAVTPLGVDAEWFEATPAENRLRSRYGLPREYVVFAGAAVPRKGLATLRQALAGTDLPPLVRIGPGHTSTSELCTGYLPDAELRAIVAGARALVLPSLDEGFGLPALEAMACGVPVVCSDVPALREVTDGHAFLHVPGDVDSLRAALRAAIDDGAHASELRAHAGRFTWEACARATLTAYHRARG